MNINKCVLCIFLLLTSAVFSQLKLSNFSGSVNLTSNYYHISGDAENRQQETLSRAIIRLNFNIHPDIQLPFEIYFSSLNNRYQQPFNQIGVNPVISDWMILHAGYFSSRISDLTFGDLRILGGGVELTTGNLRLKLLYGLSKKAISPDPVSKFRGTFRQTMYALSLGYGRKQSSCVNVNLFHAVDDSNSITPLSDNSLTRLAPNENIIGSVDFSILFSKIIDVKGEAAVSGFSNDLRSEEADIHFSVPHVLFTPRKSSQTDGSAKMTLEVYPSKFWSVALLGRWIGPGYNTLGYSWLQNDIYEISAGPTVRLFQSKWVVKGLAGFNRNNLRNNRKSTTRRYNSRVNIYGQLLTNLILEIQYLNNQIRSYHSLDSVRASNVYNFVSVTPNYSFEGFGGRNTISVNYSYQIASDRNPKLYTSVKNVTNMLNTIYRIYLPSSLTLTSNALFNSVQYTDYTFKTLNLSEGVSSNFWNNRFSFSLNLGYTNSGIELVNTQLLLNFYMSYQLLKYGTVSVNVSNNNYDGFRNQIYIDESAGKIKFNELQASLQYNLNF